MKIKKYDKKELLGMEKLHQQAKYNKTKVEQRSIVHPMLANAELQIKDQALEIIP